MNCAPRPDERVAARIAALYSWNKIPARLRQERAFAQRQRRARSKPVQATAPADPWPPRACAQQPAWQCSTAAAFTASSRCLRGPRTISVSPSPDPALARARGGAQVNASASCKIRRVQNTSRARGANKSSGTTGHTSAHSRASRDLRRFIEDTRTW